MRPIRGADLFCGSGGFSTSLVRACEELFPGRELDLVAVNHWQVAIDTHQVNHPGVRHFCADLEHLQPRDAVPGGVLDILLAAPSCTYHSRARGGRPVYDQQRMDPWHVVRWCTDLRVYALQVENVPEFVDWGPCDVRTGKPIKARKGEYFRAWINALKAVGMRVEWKVLTCADYGDATTRQRFFLYGRSDKKRLRWPEPTHAKGGGDLKRWRAAAEIIDWQTPGTSIFTRQRPLVKNTLARLLAGAERNHWPAQHVAALRALIAGKRPRLKVTPEEAAANRRRSERHLAALGRRHRPNRLPDRVAFVAVIPMRAQRHKRLRELDVPGRGHGRYRVLHLVRARLLPAALAKVRHEERRRDIADGYYIDILYRMLHWSELARATSFEDQGRTYHFTGTATDITKQIGNAVPIRTGTALCTAALQALSARGRARRSDRMAA